MCRRAADCVHKRRPLIALAGTVKENGFACAR
jgi:hypothetical protein